MSVTVGYGRQAYGAATTHQLGCKIVGKISCFEGMMKRIPAVILLIALSFASLTPAKAQIFMGPDSARQAQKAAKKEQRARDKAAKKQQKAMRKQEKAQRKAARKG